MYHYHSIKTVLLVWVYLSQNPSLVSGKQQYKQHFLSKNPKSSRVGRITVPRITYVEGEDVYAQSHAQGPGQHFEDIFEPDGMDNLSEISADKIVPKDDHVGDNAAKIYGGLVSVHSRLLSNSTFTYPKRLKFDLRDPTSGEIYSVDLRKNYKIFDDTGHFWNVENGMDLGQKYIRYTKTSKNESVQNLVAVPDCYYQGYVKSKSKQAKFNRLTSAEPNDVVGYIAVSLCHGIEGVLHTDSGDFSIKPRRRPEITERYSGPSNSHKSHSHSSFRSLDKSLQREHILKTLSSVYHARGHSSKNIPHNCGVDLDIDQMVTFNKTNLAVAKGLDSYQLDIEVSGADGPGQIYNLNVDQDLDSAKEKIYTIKVSIFVDSFLYDQLLKKGLKTDADILLYVLTIFNGVQLLYSHKSMGVRLQLVLSHFEIMKDPKPEIIHERVTHLLEAFGSFQRKLNNPRRWDVAILMTGLDVYAIAKRIGASNKVALARAILGYAYVGSMCDSKYSVTISEGKGYKPVFTIAHELGHTLGLEHDGKDNDCEDWKYIMASRLAPGISTWSSCSRKRMQKFIKHFECLKDSIQANDIVVEDPLIEILPGQRATVDDQCEAAYGPGSRWLSDPRYPLETVCKLIRCTPAHGTYIVVELLIHPAMEGTFCGKGKWCRSGSCTPYPADAIINGGWTSWSTSGCSLSAVAACLSEATSFQAWVRRCTNPQAANGGAPCTGTSIIYQSCPVATKTQSSTLEPLNMCKSGSITLDEYIDDTCLTINATADIPLNGLFFRDLASAQPSQTSEGINNHISARNDFLNTHLTMKDLHKPRSDDYNSKYGKYKRGSAQLDLNPRYSNKDLIQNSFVMVQPKLNPRYQRNLNSVSDVANTFQNRFLSEDLSTDPITYFHLVDKQPPSDNNQIEDLLPIFSNVYSNNLSPCKFHCFQPMTEKIKSLNIPNGISCDIKSTISIKIPGVCIDGQCKPFERRDGSWGQFVLESDCENRECLEKSVNLKYYKRKCDNPPPLNGGKQCKGGDTLYQICRDKFVCINKKKTPEEYATNICGLLSKLPEYKFLTGQGVRYPYNNHRLRCAIWCKTDRGGMISPSGLYFPDGTNCHRKHDANSHMYCLRRTCVEFKKNGKPSVS